MLKAPDMTKAHHTLPLSLAPLGLRREAAAEFVSVSVSKFDQLVADGRMPKPLHIDGVVAWDVEALINAWRRLRDQAAATEGNEWDRAMRLADK